MNGPDQTAFLDALFDAAKPVPQGLADASGNDAMDTAKRMAVYRNNVAFSLIHVLGAAFPLLADLLGRDAFVGLAQAFWRAHPPRDPLMFRYGGELPEFLNSHTGLAHVPYAADVARLDKAMNEVSHAADETGLPPAELADGHIEEERLRFVAAMQIVTSDWPLADIYLYLCGHAPPPANMSEAQSLLVYRDADYQVHCAPMPCGGDALMTAMLAGVPLAEAAEAATGLDEAGMVELFSLLVQNGLITARTTIDRKDSP